MLLLEDKLNKLIKTAAAYIPRDLGYYGDDYGNDEYLYGDVEDDLYYALKEIDPAINFAKGASKLVIIPSFCNSVIKIPLRGTWKCEYYYDEEEERYDYDYPVDDYFEEFENANNGYDYCADECDTYAEALGAGVHPIFAETRFYGEFNGTRFYLQEKVNCDYYDDSRSSSHSREEVREIVKTSGAGSCITAYSWLSIVIDYYGQKVTNLILDYLHEKQISDIHSSNVGFRADGTPVILDYSGWGD